MKAVLSTVGNPILITLLSGQRNMSEVVGHEHKPVIFLAYFGILISYFAADQALHRFPVIAFELTVPLVFIIKSCNDFAILPQAFDLKAHLFPGFGLNPHNSICEITLPAFPLTVSVLVQQNRK